MLGRGSVVVNVAEIITNPPRDEYIDQYANVFDLAAPVARVKDLLLKKNVNVDVMEYGLFDQSQRLVGYFRLEKAHGSIWEAILVQLAQAFKGQGYGTFFYDYAVMNDKLHVVSDATQTSGPYGSRTLWLRLRDNARYPVVGYNMLTQSTIPQADPDQIYNNDPNFRWLAIPNNETINESLTRIQNAMKHRTVVWYGPGTTTEEYFNF